MRTPTRSLVPGALALGVLSLTACAKDPSKEATTAAVSEPAPAPEPAPAAAPGEEGPERLPFSNDTSRIEWVGSKVTRSHDGGFREFAGTISLDPENLSASSVEVEIQAASLYADVPDLESHLKNEDFFDVARFPTAEFRSTKIAEGGEGDATHTVTGNLTLHGVTKQVTFPATLTVADDEVSARAEFSIDCRDWGLTYPGMPDDLIRHGVVIRFDLRAPRNGEV